MYQHMNDTDLNTENWEPRFCQTDWCEVTNVSVKRDAAQPELWYVMTNTDETTYLVAATTPICPLCGSHLLTAANLYENVDEVNHQNEGNPYG